MSDYAYRGMSILGHWSPSIWISGIKILPRTISITHEMGLLFTTCWNGMSVHQPGDGKQSFHQAVSHMTFAVFEFCHCSIRLWFNSSNPGTKVAERCLFTRAKEQSTKTDCTAPMEHHLLFVQQEHLFKERLCKALSLLKWCNIHICCWSHIWLTRLLCWMASVDLEISIS